MDEDERALNEDIDEDEYDEDVSESPSDEDEDLDEPAAGGESGVDGQDETASNRTPESIPYDRFKEVNDELKELRASHRELLDTVIKGQTGQRAEKPDPEEEEPEYLTDTERLLAKENKELRQRMDRFEQGQQQTIVERAVSQFEDVTAKLAAEAGIELNASDKQALLNDVAAMGNIPINKATRLVFRDKFHDQIIESAKSVKPKPNPKKERLAGGGGASPARGTQPATEESGDLREALRSSYREEKRR